MLFRGTLASEALALTLTLNLGQSDSSLIARPLDEDRTGRTSRSNHQSGVLREDEEEHGFDDGLSFRTGVNHFIALQHGTSHVKAGRDPGLLCSQSSCISTRPLSSRNISLASIIFPYFRI